MVRLALVVTIAACCFAAAAAAQEVADTRVDFTLGRVIHSVPDSRDRIGIRSVCGEQAGCTANYAIRRAAPPALLGGIQAMLLGGTTQTDYVTLTKRMAASLRRRSLPVTITAEVKDAVGNRLTLTKQVTLGPKKKKRR
jgi:hypothetical protein